jgi:lipopolysaccharide export system protein LptA
MYRNKLLIAIILASLCSLGFAKSSDRKQPMDIAADNLDSLLTDTSESTIKGNVIISQGSLKIESDQAIVSRVNGDVTKVTLLGNAARMQQTNDNGDVMKASARKIVYLISSEQILLDGGVVIDQARGSMRGESIRYDIKTGRLTGGTAGGRIQMRLNPKASGGR